ncbi:MAG: Trk system potassium transporter TrkA [Alphaproteobacteria bacterium]|nr:Trk system potassium transporter TrkA [Alphaproteobacteria bacterium]
MKVIILGAGQVGYSIARYLALEENHITIVDQSPDLLKRISDKIDVQPIVGFASHPDVLKQAGAEAADLLIAVTGSDEVNMIACEVVQSLFQLETKIARIRNQNYLKPAWSNMFHPQRLAIDVVISPEMEVAKTLSRNTQISGAFDVISLVLDRVKVIGVRILACAPVLNTPLRLISSLFSKLELAILCISRNDVFFFPQKDDVLQINDDVHFVIRHSDIHLAMEAFGYIEEEGRRVVIIGGGNIGKTLASELETNHPNIKAKLIEKDLIRSEAAAHLLRNTEVLHGDALDYEVLAEANVHNCETAISVTNDDKVNILASLLAKRCGAKRSFTLLNNINYSSLVTSLGVDSIINPRAITVSTILQHVRQGRIRSAHTLGDGYAEIIEAEARETSHIIGLSVDDVSIKGSIMIAALVREDKILLLPKKTIVSVGDRLIILAKKDAIRKVEKIFSIRPSYL